MEAIGGDTTAAARDWLGRARSELSGVQALLDADQYRMAYRAAFDLMRNAAEVVVTAAGYRVTSAPGHHEATFAVADAFDDGPVRAFDPSRSSQARAKRGSSQYVDVDRRSEVTEEEARRCYGWAVEAVDAAARLLDRGF